MPPWRVPPPRVVQFKRKLYVVVAELVAVRGGVVAVPFTLVLFAFCEVNSGRFWLEMTHACIPEVTQPSAEVLPDWTDLGFATRTMPGFATCTLHCALPERPSLVQVSPKLAVLLFPGGAERVAVAEPDCAPFVLKPLPALVPAEHENVIETSMPTSAILG